MPQAGGSQLLSTLLYFVLLFLAAIVAVVGSVLIISFMTGKGLREKREIVQRHNIGTAVVLGAFIWTIGRICLETVKPMMNVWYSNYAGGITLAKALLFSLGVIGALLIALVVGALVVFLALKLLMIITRDIDEWKEVQEGNMAVAVVIGVTVIVVGMFFESIISFVTISLFTTLKLI